MHSKKSKVVAEAGMTAYFSGRARRDDIFHLFITPEISLIIEAGFELELYMINYEAPVALVLDEQCFYVQPAVQSEEVQPV